MVKKSKRQQSIKKKLMAAVCMLLVATIMMVSSTYAWFTLSTAPEVTGITTAVGANGNLEIALLPEDGDTANITTLSSTANVSTADKNITWGNLVDLADSTFYGLDQITLYPSKLNVNTDGETFPPSMLSIPAYGADGRVSELETDKIVTGIYDSEDTAKFLPSETDFGVRAVGVASGMTPRQLDYRNARSAAATAAAQAKTLAAQSLSDNGSALANIAIKKGTKGTEATFSQTDVNSLNTIITDLETSILPKIEEAYLQYILAYAASAATGTTDTAWQAIGGAVEADGATLESVQAVLTSNSVTLPESLTTAIGKYNATVIAVANAKTSLPSGKETYTWNEISASLYDLANPDKMEINGIVAGEIMNGDNMSNLVNGVASQGLTVTMATGGGVYADIADQCGDYSVSITIQEVIYNGLTLKNMNARMQTASTLNPNYYLTVIGTAVAGAGAPESSTDTSLPITEMYGYIIDLAFRTNAAESDLLLQTAATDRIYSDNTNESTMGSGSTMSFKATTTDFDDDQVKALMSAIRVVFFTPGASSNTILATAKMDTTNATLDAEDGWTANLYLLDENGGFITTQTDAKIQSLTQNTAQKVSVLVYLDGENLTNADVANAATSMTGKMNLQFASSATLTPMEYADLHTPGATTTAADTTTTTAATANP